MKKIICMLLTILMTVLCLCGCNSGDTGTAGEETDLSTPLALAAVIGAHKNFPALSIISDTFSDAVYLACRTYGEINLIVSEGAPEIVSNIKLSKPDKNIDAKKHDELARTNAGAVYQLLPTLKAKTAEVDLLKSISLAADVLASASTARRQLFIYDSGLCTAGLLSQLADDYISADPEELADKLDEINAFPDLEGVTVYWQGLGCTAGEQNALPDSVKAKLETMWRVILERAGAQVIFDKMPVSGAEGASLPAVTALHFEADKIVLSENTVLKFDEETFKFKPDSAEFVSADTVSATLKPIAQQLISQPQLKIYIAGTTATVGVTEETPVTGVELSLERAEACKALLVAMGASEEQIICKGLGSADNHLRTDDIDDNGNLIEEKAAQNRAIYIFTTTSDTAAQLGF